MEYVNEEVFLIPTKRNSGSIVYAPLKGMYFWLCEDYAKQYREVLENGKELASIRENTELYQRVLLLNRAPSQKPRERTFSIDNHVVIILSQLCNFECSYCYARYAHSNDIIDWSTIERVLGIVLATQQKEIKVTFIGGGEPLATFQLLKKAAEYAEEKANAVGKFVRFSLTTNGSLVSAERAFWLKQHGFTVSISFEILPEIQNMQRPMLGNRASYEAVDRGIRNLIRAGVPLRFRSTITNANVSQMQQMVRYALKNYPEVTRLHFEHVSDNSIDLESYYKQYIASFFAARKTAKEHGVRLTNSILSSLQCIKDVFCAGEVCVTPSGSIVSCHRASSLLDSLYDSFRVYDSCNDIENTKVCSMQILTELLPECSKCFARWHCAGACTYNRQIYSKSQMKLLCKFTRDLIREYFESTLSL